MSKHIGIKPGEMFVGNVNTADGIPQHLSTLKTARLGDVALDLDGKRISYMQALFIGESESSQYDSIQMSRMSKSSRGN